MRYIHYIGSGNEDSPDKIETSDRGDYTEYLWLTTERVAPDALAPARRLHNLSAPTLAAQCTRGRAWGIISRRTGVAGWTGRMR